MKLTAKVKLQPNTDQCASLLSTLEKANLICNEISEVAWDNQTYNKFRLQNLVYNDVRQSSGLTAQVVVRCISKVADAYKLDKKTKRVFDLHGAIAFDARILSWKLDKREISIWTVDGRQKMTFFAGPRQLELLKGQRGESDLCLVDGNFYLFATCEVESATPKDVDDVLGVDLGVKNIAVDSDGDVHSAKAVNNVRYCHARLRAKLQSKSTQAAKRRLRKLSGKERRFATWVNHNVSQCIVTKAKDTNRGIALEELGGIRERATVRRSQRAMLHNWAFAQLRNFIEYKAQKDGVPVFLVDPRNTSRTCPHCGHISKANRLTQAKFLCVQCGFSGLADHIAATNIRSRAVVNRPHIPDAAQPDSSARDKAHDL